MNHRRPGQGAAGSCNRRDLCGSATFSYFFRVRDTDVAVAALKDLIPLQAADVVQATFGDTL